MDKKTFLKQLNKAFRSLPRKEREDRLRFYSEMIDDRMEEGLTEEEAVAAIGSVEALSAELPCPKKRQWKAWEIVLLVLGSPLWISLLAAAFAVVLALFVSLWAVILCLWIAFAASVICAFVGLAAALMLFFSKPYTGFAMLSAALICAGLSIFLFFGCKWVTKGSAFLTKRVLRIRKGAAA